MLLSKKLNLPYTNEKGKFQIVLSGLQLKELDKRFIDKIEIMKKIIQLFAHKQKNTTIELDLIFTDLEYSILKLFESDKK